MKRSDFDYPLPPELIAQTPMEPRDHSRLMVVNRDKASIEHRLFYHIVDYFHPGDVLVFNDTRVIPARLFGYTEAGSQVEILLLRRQDNGIWETIGRPGKKLKPGVKIRITKPSQPDITLMAEVIDKGEEGTRIVHFSDEGLMERLFVTLHIGLDTFRPVREEDPKQHPIHREYGTLSEEAVQSLNRAKKEGKRIIAVGTVLFAF